MVVIIQYQDFSMPEWIFFIFDVVIIWCFCVTGLALLNLYCSFFNKKNEINSLLELDVKEIIYTDIWDIKI